LTQILPQIGAVTGGYVTDYATGFYGYFDGFIKENGRIFLMKRLLIKENGQNL